MLLEEVVEVSRRVAETSKRTEKIELLSGLLRRLGRDEVEIVVDFLSGTTRQGKIGVGWRTLQEASAEPAPAATLTIGEVDAGLTRIAEARGSGKREVLHGMLLQATASEQQFLGALLMGELRQGALAGVMLEGVAKAATVNMGRLRRAAMMAGDIPTVARAVLEQGEAGLTQFDVQLLRPVQPMLAQSAEDADEAIAELGEAALEWKLDGARMQAHKSGDDVVIFSRRLNEVSAAIPEIVEAVRALPAKEAILDGEVISLDENARPNPFQVTMRRFGRKLDVDRMHRELPLSPFWFDLLYLDGGSLMDEPQARRFAALEDVAPAAALVPHILTADVERARDFLKGALERGHEGIMVKSTEAAYAAGARGQSWLKVKQARTLDLVILAAEWGHGRRHGTLSNLHLGARDTKNGGFAMLGKTFKGLTDEMLAWQTQELLKIEIARDSYTVYVEPKIVVEIAFNEIQVSPRYPSGLALRFARVKRYRPDKQASGADTFETVQRLAGTL